MNATEEVVPEEGVSQLEREIVLLAEGPGGEVVLTMDEPPANKKDDIEHNLNGERIAPR